MFVKQIPRDEWEPFCQSFSRQHRRWLVTIEVIDESGASRIMARDEPLKEVAVELANGKPDRIFINVGTAPRERLAHTVAAPSAVTFERSEEGAHGGMSIESGSGEKTVLRFRSEVLPEMVDGIVLE